MSFFDRPPSDARRDGAVEGLEHEPFGAEFFADDPHAAWVGGVIPLQFVLARSDDAAVTITHLTAFPDGFEFVVGAKIRHVKRSPQEHGGPWFDPYPHRCGSKDQALSEDVLCFGVEFPDGARATNLDPWMDTPAATRPPHGLWWGGSLGTRDGFGILNSWHYSAWPLPATGELTMVCEWPAYDIPESRRTIPGEDFASALNRAEQLWPEHHDHQR